MRFFHVTVHPSVGSEQSDCVDREAESARRGPTTGEETTSRGVSARSGPCFGAPANLPPFDRAFEEVYAALERLPRLFIEPDGSFVWVASHEENQWQLDGVLYDARGRLQFVELKGRCTSEALDRLLAALGWPQTRIVFQLVENGVFLDETSFRRELAVHHGGNSA